MDIQLYVYDLSKGLAREVSAAFLGVQIDAIYHTAIVMEGIEYLYDGGIKTAQPGMTHLGKPMKIMELGKTDLPMDVIIEYLESLKGIYTAAVSEFCSLRDQLLIRSSRRMIFGLTTATTSPTISLPF
jgi:hypothetical protein